MLIECLAGPITENVMGHGYTFARDRYGRSVAEVLNKKHQKCFLSVVAHYREVPEIPVDLPAPDTPGLMGEILEGDGAVPGLGDFSDIDASAATPPDDPAGDEAAEAGAPDATEPAVIDAPELQVADADEEHSEPAVADEVGAADEAAEATAPAAEEASATAADGNEEAEQLAAEAAAKAKAEEDAAPAAKPNNQRPAKRGRGRPKKN